jgi:tRNA (guanine37-N1)-methyltransferase
MFRVDIITLFPDMFKGPFDMSMLWKAQDRGLAQINLIDLREFGLGARRTVDDTPYGGGDGMVLKPEPVVAAIESAKALNPGAPVVVMTPSGHKYDQATAKSYAELPGLILLAGHYEGFDERIMTYVDDQVSIGDYVLTGGELPAMVVVDSVLRLIPGVLGGEQSAHDESFSEPGLLEYPHYTRPAEFRGEKVPEVLQNGHHAEIDRWRRDQARAKTRHYRPDLLGHE